MEVRENQCPEENCILQPHSLEVSLNMIWEHTKENVMPYGSYSHEAGGNSLPAKGSHILWTSVVSLLTTKC